MGEIIYINKTYSRFLDIDIKSSLGRPIREVITNSRLPIVAKTGIPEVNYPHKYKNTGFLVHRIPLREEGRIIAVLGLVLFDSATTVTKLAEKLDRLESKIVDVQKELANVHTPQFSFDNIIGESKSLNSIKREARNAAGTNMPVLITGESGTGKELFAHAIHNASAPQTFSVHSG